MQLRNEAFLKRAIFGTGLLLAALAAILPVAAAQTLTTTTVQDTIYRADGTLASGTLIVSWPAFTTAANVAVAAGSNGVQIAANGTVTLSLAPNAGAFPGGTYYSAVYHLSDGTVNKEYWVVPVAASTTIGAIRSQLLPATVAIQAVSKQYVDAAVAAIDSNAIPASGGTMTGPLLLSGDPTSAQQAADKHYVDDSVESLLPISGGSLTGPLTLAADPVAALQAATKEYVDANSSAGALAAAAAAQATANAALPAARLGVAGGAAPLDVTARVPAANMPVTFTANESFAAGLSVSGGAIIAGGTITDTMTATGALTSASLTASGAVTAATLTATGNINSTQLTSGSITSSQVNKVFYADGYPAAGCTVGSTATTTELDCAVATADAWILTNNAGAKLVLGSGTYYTCSGILLPSLNGYFGTLSIQGASQEQTIISQSCTITNAVIYHADAINGNLSRLLLRDFRINANQKAPSCMDIFGVNESKIENINCSGASGTDHFLKIGDTPANGSNGQVYQTPVSNVYITGKPLPVFASVTANVVGGSITSYTVTNGGSNYGSTNQVYLLGYGYSKNPCQVMPTSTVTVVGGVVTAVTPVTTGSNCSGTITVMISSLPAAAYGIVFGNFTDNTLYDVATGGVGTTAAIEVLEGDNVFYHFHPNGSPIGVSDYGNAYYGTECDSMYEFCFDVEGGTGIFGTTFTWNDATAYPLSAGYYISPNAFNAKIIGSMQCLTNVPAGYVQFWNQYGPVTSALPSGVTVVADRACSGTSQTLFGEPVYLNATNRATSTNNYFSQPLYFSDSFWNNIAPVNDPWQMVVGGTPSGSPTFENLNFYAPVGFYSTFQPTFKLSYNTSATAALNYNSPGWDLNATYWDGTQSQSSDWIVKQTVASGANPVSTLTFTPTKTGATTLQAQVVVPSLQIVPGTATQPSCNAVNRALHWYVQGTPDHEQVCVQSTTAGSYGWVQAF
jgi:hypothetical protein